MTVHGDDFISEGTWAALVWFDEQLKRHFEVNTDIMGEHADLANELRLLNRLVTWTAQGIVGGT